MGKVLGVGSGVFVLAFLLVLCLVTCFFGSKTRFGSYTFLGSTGTFLLVLLILLVAPREGEDEDSFTDEKDHTVIERGVMLVTMIIGIVLAIVGLLLFHVEPPKYARPIDYRLDVLRGA